MTDPTGGDRRFFVFNAIVSTVALSVLAWLLLLREGGGTGSDLSFMPDRLQAQYALKGPDGAAWLFQHTWTTSSPSLNRITYRQIITVI